MPEPIKADTHAFPLRCRKCGSNRLTVPAHSTNGSIVTCTDCGAEIGRWATCESASLKKPTGKGRQTCRPARSGCPSWLCGVAETAVHFKDIASTFPSLALKDIIHSTIFSSCRSGG